MEIAPRAGVRDMRALAKRVHRRWLEYRRRHPGMSIPISDTLSRILEHEPDYRPLRPRAASKRRQRLQNPGVFTLQEVADALQTTVGDLLAEPGYASPRDLIPLADRRKLRDVLNLLRDLFDLEDESLDEQPNGSFMVDPRFQVIRVVGDSMAPELMDGGKVLVDTSRTVPAEDALVVVYGGKEGGAIGRWHVEEGEPQLMKANPDYPPTRLGSAENWTIWGTVTAILETPAESAGRRMRGRRQS